MTSIQLPVGSGNLIVLGQGLAMYVDESLEASIRAHDDGGRLVIAELTVKGDRVTGRLLSQLPLGRIEEILNSPQAAALLRAESQGRVTAGDLVAPSEEPGLRNPTLVVPAGRSYPDQFYVDVAASYGWHALQTRKPAVAIAEEVGVPTTTVHRWLKEARARGLLAPSRQRPADGEREQR
jgi:hypothetical protein